jgi:hypothetical protein
MQEDVSKNVPRVFSHISCIMNKIEIRCVVGDFLLAHYGVPRSEALFAIVPLQAFEL